MRASRSYKDILLDAYQASGGDSDGPGTEIAASLNRWINRRLRWAWDYYPWPDVRSVEQRAFRLDYAAGTTYAATTLATPVEVFYPPAQLYYQSLVAANIGNAPATWDCAEWDENSAYWAECQDEYSGSDWAAGTVPALGDVVRNAVGATADYEYYQCITAHTADTVWATHAAKFAILVPFVRSIDYAQTGQTAIGLISANRVTAKDPRIYVLPDPQPFTLYDDYLVVHTDLAEVWLDFHRACPTLDGDAWASAIYALGARAYYDTTGDYYQVIATMAEAKAITDTTYWERLTVPSVLADYIAQGAAADWLGKAERRLPEYGTAEDEAYFLLERELDKLTRQQGQTKTNTQIVHSYT